MKRVLVLLGLLSLFGSGCGEQTGPTTRPSTPVSASESSVAWMEQFCTITDDLRAALWGSAAEPGSGEPTNLKQRLESQLTAAVEALGVAVEDLEALPANPPAGASEAATDLDRRLGGLRDSVETGRDSLASLPPDATEQDLGQVLAKVWPDVAARAGKPLDGVPLTEEMKAAATGPNCRTLPELR